MASIKHPQAFVEILTVFVSFFSPPVGKLCTSWISVRKQWTTLYPLPPWEVILRCAWVIWANLAKLCGVCLLHLLTASIKKEGERERERDNEKGRESVRQTKKKKESKRRIIPGGAELLRGLPFCQVAQWRDRRTPGQLIKVRCGWMPWVTHDSCLPLPKPTTTATTHTYTNTQHHTALHCYFCLHPALTGRKNVLRRLVHTR